jgi:hypothetical protein
VDISTHDVSAKEVFRVYQQCCRRLRMTTGPDAVVASRAGPRGTVGSAADADAATPSLMTESSLRSAARSIAGSATAPPTSFEGGSSAGAGTDAGVGSPAACGQWYVVKAPPATAVDAVATHAPVASIVRSDPGTDRALDADNIGAAASELEPTGEEELHGKCDAIDSDGASVELRVVTIRTHIVKKKRTTAQQKLGCSACNFTSRYAHVVRRHFLVHTGLRPYQCSHCDYSASQANNLAQHCSARHDPKAQRLTVTICAPVVRH